MELGMNGAIAAAQAGIEAQVEALSQPPIQPPVSLAESGGGVAASFAHSLDQAISGVDDKERVADEKMAAVDSGRSDDLVGAMLASQEASLSFSLLMQVRNKVVGAMDDLLKLQL